MAGEGQLSTHSGWHIVTKPECVLNRVLSQFSHSPVHLYLEISSVTFSGGINPISHCKGGKHKCRILSRDMLYLSMLGGVRGFLPGKMQCLSLCCLTFLLALSLCSQGSSHSDPLNIVVVAMNGSCPEIISVTVTELGFSMAR